MRMKWRIAQKTFIKADSQTRALHTKFPHSIKPEICFKARTSDIYEREPENLEL